MFIYGFPLKYSHFSVCLYVHRSLSLPLALERLLRNTFPLHRCVHVSISYSYFNIHIFECVYMCIDLSFLLSLSKGCSAIHIHYIFIYLFLCHIHVFECVCMCTDLSPLLSLSKVCCAIHTYFILGGYE